MVVLSNHSPRFTSFWQANHLSTFSSNGMIFSHFNVVGPAVLMFTSANVLPRAPFAADARPARLSAHCDTLKLPCPPIIHARL